MAAVLMMKVLLVWSTWLVGTLLVTDVGGVILCQCSTAECRAEGRSTCSAVHFCYSELFHDTLTRGCIDEGSSLLCENRRPRGKGIHHWPVLFCCNDRALCNKDVAPSSSSSSSLSLSSSSSSASASIHTNGSAAEEDTSGKAATPTPADEKHPHHTPTIEPRHHHHHHDNHPEPHDKPPQLCHDAAQHPHDSSSSSSRSRSRVINPIYIAVPAAGVCILLALVIFAMYLLRRRRHHFHDNYYNHYYHDHHHNNVPPTSSSSSSSSRARKLPGGLGGEGSGGRLGGGGGGGGGGGVPLYLPQHQCECMCQQILPPCHSSGGGRGGERLNRCTDSERSSSGSETKLFLQA